jgi:hypothetical protein
VPDLGRQDQVGLERADLLQARLGQRADRLRARGVLAALLAEVVGQLLVDGAVRRVAVHVGVQADRGVHERLVERDDPLGLLEDLRGAHRVLDGTQGGPALAAVVRGSAGRQAEGGESGDGDPGGRAPERRHPHLRFLLEFGKANLLKARHTCFR